MSNGKLIPHLSVIHLPRERVETMSEAIQASTRENADTGGTDSDTRRSKDMSGQVVRPLMQRTIAPPKGGAMMKKIWADLFPHSCLLSEILPLAHKFISFLI